MNARSQLLAGLAAGALATWAGFACAQTGPAAPAAPPLHGTVAGLCTFSAGDVIGGSKVGQSVLARLKMLDTQWRTELQPEADGINTEGRTLEQQRATLDAATLQAREANLQLRYTNLQKRAQQREQEMQATQQKQFNTIRLQLLPILNQLAEQHACGVVLDRDNSGIYAWNPAADFTGQAVGSLDIKIQSLTFDREHLDTQPATTPGAPRPGAGR